jgi:hypothetical protein
MASKRRYGAILCTILGSAATRQREDTSQCPSISLAQGKLMCYYPLKHPVIHCYSPFLTVPEEKEDEIVGER